MRGFIPGGGVHGFIREGGHAWFYSGGGMRGFIRGGAWFYSGGVRGFIRGGMRGFIRGGMRGFIQGGAGVSGFMRGGRAWFYSGGGVRGFSSFCGYNEIRSMSGRYASYWNAFLYYMFFIKLFQLHNASQLTAWCLWFVSSHYTTIYRKHSKIVQSLKPDNQVYLSKHRWPPLWYEVSFFNCYYFIENMQLTMTYQSIDLTF